MSRERAVCFEVASCLGKMCCARCCEHCSFEIVLGASKLWALSSEPTTFSTSVPLELSISGSLFLDLSPDLWISALIYLWILFFLTCGPLL